MKRTGNRKARWAALLCAAAVALLCACGQAGGGPKSVSAGESALPAADGALLAGALRQWYDPDGKGDGEFEVRDAAVVKEENRDDCPLIDEPLSEEGDTWRDYLEKEPARRLFTAVIRVKYSPERAIDGPQYGDGIWTVWGVLEPAGSEKRILHCGITDIAGDDAPADPEAAALGLTDDQWTMAQHQVAALAACGVWRDYASPADWTREEFTRWLALRAKDWPSGDGDTLSVYRAEWMVQADFSPENGVWGGMNMRLRESGLFTDGQAALPAVENPARFLEERAEVEYRREAAQLPVPAENAPQVEPDELVATVTIDGGTCMEYRFGLIGEGAGPVSRTWLKEARLLDGEPA